MNQIVETKPQHLNIDPAGILSALKNAFSQHSNVIKELAQNARRAGATRIDFHFDPEKDEIEILDNGKGIEDLRQLLSTAKSSWSEDVAAAENPYGLGMLASFFSCEEIEVSSCHQYLCEKTEAILTFQQVDIQPVTTYGGVTSIKLRGGVTKLMEIDYEELFAGFPVQVFVNYEPLKQNEALGKQTFIPSEIGEVYLCNLPKPDWLDCKLNYARLIRFYYQGFYIGYGGLKDVKHAESLITPAHIVHLDCSEFRAIAPDRHCLIDANEARDRIENVINLLIQHDIQSKVNTPEGREILLTSYYTVKSYQQLSVYNQIDSLPIQVLSVFSGYPVLESNRLQLDREMVVYPSFITKEEILKLEKFVFEPLDEQDDEHDFKAHMYCWEIDGFVLNNELDPDHWIYPLLVKAKDISVKLDLASVKEPTVSQANNGLDHNAVFCDFAEIEGPRGTLKITTSFVSGDKAILVLSDSSKNIIYQSTSFVDEYVFDESRCDTCSESFYSFLQRERLSGKPNVLIEEALNNSGIFTQSMLGKQFLLTVNESGEFQVISPEA